MFGVCQCSLGPVPGQGHTTYKDSRNLLQKSSLRAGIWSTWKCYTCLTCLNLPSGKIYKLAFLFKLSTNLLYPEAPLTPRTLHYPTCTVHSAPYRQLHGRTYQYLYSFFPYAISLWNNLPSNTIISSNVHNFKEAMYEYFCI